jgi:5-carboxymethyl-2-hydroxymuconate isomerase
MLIICPHPFCRPYAALSCGITTKTRKGDIIQFDYVPTEPSAAGLLENERGVIPPCRISRSNIPPISMSASTWRKWSRPCARPRWKPAFSRWGGIRVRAVRCEHFAIADGGKDYGFLDMVLRLGEGRDLATRKKAGEHIFRTLTEQLDPVFASGKFALSFDMQINDKETSWKRNNIHEALKAEAAHG